MTDDPSRNKDGPILHNVAFILGNQLVILAYLMHFVSLYNCMRVREKLKSSVICVLSWSKYLINVIRWHSPHFYFFMFLRTAGHLISFRVLVNINPGYISLFLK